MGRLRSGFSVVVMLVLVTLGLANGARATETITCGMHVDHSIVVGNDLTTPCSGSGLIVAASNIIIDLNGHTLHGTTYSQGITDEDPANFANVHILNGTVDNWGDGIRANTTGWVIDGVTVSHNFAYGMWIGGDGLQILNSHALDNGRVGIVARASVVSGNSAERNAESGFEVIADLIDHNSAFDNLGNGLYVDEVSDGSVSDNILAGNHGDGLVIGGITQREQVTGNGGFNNRGRGIVVGGGYTRLSYNQATGNFLSGILVSGPRHQLKRNLASDNGFSGGVSDGSGVGIDALGASHLRAAHNHAHGNDDHRQCLPRRICN